MLRTDTAAVALHPLIYLTADALLPPSVLAEAALFAATQSDPTGWLPVHRPGRTMRALLMRAGLVEPGDPLIGPESLVRRIPTPKDGGSDPARLLWAARLLRQLGRFQHCALVLGRITEQAPPEVRGWRDLLLAECGGRPAIVTSDASSEVLGLTACLATLASSSSSSSSSPPPSGELFAVAQRLGDRLPEAWQRALARARILAIQLAHGGTGATDELCADLAGHRAAGADDFLVREGELALRLAAAESRLSASDAAAAQRHARAALTLDPAGAGSHLLAARAALAASNIDEARRRFRSAARLGLMERRAALCGLADLALASADPGADVALPGVVADLLSHDPSEETDRLRALVNRAGPLRQTIAADSVRWASTALDAQPESLGNGPPPTAGRALRCPLPLERYRPFIDLRLPEHLHPQDQPPVAIHTPLMSYAAVTGRREPWFEEIHPQRATADLFRREMERTAWLYGYQSGGVSANYGVWLHAPDGCPPHLREMLLGAADLPLLDRALLARLVSAIGFQVAARDMLPGPETPVTSPESAYAVASWLFAEQMHTSGHAAELDPHFRRLYAQLGDDPRYARGRVVTTINATVNAARRREPGTIAFWRAEGERVLARYVALPEVNDFHAALMTSRWYRAMGFLPFLTGDRDLLRSDMDQWLGIATELVGYDEHTKIIAADNYFPAVETAIRTHIFLGDSATALQLVEKLAAEIDPIDPKTWLTAGELRFQAGDVTGARDAYLRAAHLQFPYGRLSWFNVGQCHEQLGEFEEAAESYRRSLAHWPTGVTPLRRLRDLQAAGKLAADGQLMMAWAAGQPAWDRL
jgi:tetratricopeptide (TPR) repeat protein